MQGRQVDPLGAIYAEALAQAAEAAGGIELVQDIGDRLLALAEAWRQDRVLRAFFLSAEVKSGDKAAALDKLAAEHPPLFGNFLRLLLQRDRGSRLPQVADAYEAILDDKLGRIPVTLTTALPVPEERLKQWTQTIREKTGKDPVVKHVVRPDILAGAIIQVGDTVADGSARRRIAEMRKHIMERGKHALQA